MPAPFPARARIGRGLVGERAWTASVRRRVMVVLSAFTALVCSALPAAAASDPATPVVPTPVTVVLAGGAGLYTQAAAGVLSISDCVAGNFCLWSLPGFTGNLWQYSASASTVALAPVTYSSFLNNRSTIAALGSTSAGVGGSSYCIAAAGQSGNLSGWMRSARSVYLAGFQTVC